MAILTEDSLDILRGRFLRLLGPRGCVHIEKACGVSRLTLWRFIRGGPVSLATLEKIDLWCAEEAQRLSLERTHGVTN